MGRDRSEIMGARPGLSGFWDRLRYREIYRQALGLLLVAACALWAEPGGQRVAWGLVVATLGQGWRIFAAGTISKNRRLATSGAYAVVRHPLYLGNMLILAGFCLAGGNLWVTLGVVAFFLVWYPAAVQYEDGKLERLFADEWRAWRGETRAIVPGPFSFRRLMDTRWSARQSLIRNGELYISVYLAACGVWLWFRTHA